MDQFWRRVQRGRDDECWPWMGAINDRGYGVLQVKGKMIRAHRLAYELTNSAIPSGLQVLHRCDNRACCNPSHLCLGTHAENMRDMARKGRAIGGCRPRKLSWHDVCAIRASCESTGPLARRYGVDKKYLSDIRNFRARKFA